MRAVSVRGEALLLRWAAGAFGVVWGGGEEEGRLE